MKKIVKAVVRAHFDCPLEKVWNVVTDLEEYTWRSDLSKIEVKDNAHFVEYTKNNFPTFFTITEKKEKDRYSFSLENKNIKGKWTGLFKEEGTGTSILFTEEISVSTFLMKVLAPSYLKRMQKTYIKDLEKKLSEIA